MDITIGYNNICLKNANLGKSFEDMKADLIIDKYGRVKVIMTKTSFSTGLDNLPYEMLSAISKVLESGAKNKILERIEEKVKSNMCMRDDESQKIIEKDLELS
ncbi:MAG: hypothetical protein QG670_1692 [Thermoproteota archaeon]|nr:hypothetical protein [Thermoproteota archaeon]